MRTFFTLLGAALIVLGVLTFFVPRNPHIGLAGMIAVAFGLVVFVAIAILR